jgi:hypothetical protein
MQAGFPPGPANAASVQPEAWASVCTELKEVSSIRAAIV